MSAAPLSAYLPLRYVLTDTLAVRTAFDPLRIDSELTVAGRAQRGMLAAALMRMGRTRDLEAWVARGEQVWFAPAHPRLEGSPEGSGRRRAEVAYPPPAYLFTPGKDADTMVDVFAEGATDPGVPYRAVREPLTLDRSARVTVRTTAEQYLGQARTGQNPQGVPFFTTSIDSGQVFEARWQLRGHGLGSLQELAERIIEPLAAAEGTLTLGSGGTRAHGGVHVSPADPGRLLSPDRVDRRVSDRSVPAGEAVDLVLLSPALLVGADGQARPQALVPAVLDLMDRCVPGVGVQVLASHVEAELVGAYHRGYRGPMAQRWAARPGAVVRLRLDRDLDTEQVRDVEARPLGERAVDGHGQFALLPPPTGSEPLAPVEVPLVGRTQGSITLPGGRTVAATAPFDPKDADGQLRSLYDELLWNAAAQPVRDHARMLARQSAPWLAILTPGLLDRLREVAGHPHRTPECALAALGRTVTGEDSAALRSWLEDLSGPEAAVTWWYGNRPSPEHSPDYARAVAAVDLALPDGMPTDHPSGLSEHAREWESRSAARLCLVLVSSWLAEAARVLRSDREGAASPGREGER